MGNRFRKYFNQLIYLRCLRKSSETPEAERERQASLPMHMVNASPQSRRSGSLYLSPVIRTLNRDVTNKYWSQLRRMLILIIEHGPSFFIQ